ncbi:MAG: hypothetical protein ACO3UU_06530 [Minisyncoccia bacterium]
MNTLLAVILSLQIQYNPLNLSVEQRLCDGVRYEVAQRQAFNGKQPIKPRLELYRGIT